MSVISLQLYSVRDLLTSDRDATLARLAEIGLTAVEPYNPLDDPDGTRRRLADLGISVPTSHGWGLDGPEPDKVIEAARTLGAGKLVIASIAKEQFTDADGVKRATEKLHRLAERAAAFDLTLGYHNHWWEFGTPVGDVYALEYVAEQVPEIFFEVDTYWAAVGGADVVALLGRLGDRVQAIHVKDGPVVRDQPNVVLGTGSMDIPAVLAAAPQALPVIEFDTCATDIVEAIAASYGYLAGGAV
jgi:sugar phosphate isomerase/epimerase